MRTLAMQRFTVCWSFAVALGLLSVLVPAAPCNAQSAADELPFDYHRTKGDNSLTRLFAKVDAGELTLEYDPHYGVLPALLDALEIPVSSQGLVFSKTSLQAGRISPKNPRAIYFNDDVYIGWVQGSSLLEISTADPHLGAAFYTIRMRPGRNYLQRENNSCLACHYLPTTQRVPGHTVRSVLTRASGNINSLERSYVTDHTSPFAQRWGGWYVTGQLGGMQHMGNAFLEGEELVPHGQADRPDVSRDIDTSRWLSPHSDIVALMVLEHQTYTHNTLTRANVDVLQAMQARAGQDDESSGQAMQAVLDASAKRIVDNLLFVGEAKLESPLKGSSTFATDFARRGPFDQQGRTLRAFDLETRLFRFPCSYLIYSSSFDALEPALREQIYRRLWNVLSGQDNADEYSHLSPEMRATILEILQQTKQGLPEYWTGI